MAFWWLWIVVTLAYIILKILLAIYYYFVRERPRNVPSTADIKVFDVSYDGKKTRGKRGNASKKGSSGKEDIDAENELLKETKLQKIASILKYTGSIIATMVERSKQIRTDGHSGNNPPCLEPTPEHNIILELLYECGLVEPTMGQMEQIIKQLSEYGRIEGTGGVSQWFRARQAEERREQASSSLIPTSTEGLKPNIRGMDMDKLLSTERLLSEPENLPTESQWRPTSEQKSILELLYDCGLRCPTMQQIIQITKQLSQCGNTEGIDVYGWFRAHKAEERPEQASSNLVPTSTEELKIETSPTSSGVTERDKGKAIAVEDKSGTGKVRIPSEISSHVSQEQENSDNSRYDSTGKRLPINIEKQREQIPDSEGNIDVRANIIFLDRDHLEESDPHIPNQQETVSPSATSTEGEESRSGGQNSTEAVPKRRRWFKPFSWWQRK
ncbi:hypothetical protein C5167_029842 [Papaver somniferum]|uniref:uncharacterized protein LOC113328499 isoform X2 n=1 Tax=Papaver somniferum TaxID=3469 RepID=UPI000E702D74|nr:uncharacterized protein LOC113328499 isoform X2 [Papaver somniferum]RZC87295.1 hypothetical protein C5167_029842 [Papaver somniferum]